MGKVGCAGILVEDTFCGPMPTLPSEGALLALEDMPVRAGGCAANVAIDLAKQGVSVDVAGCLGDDSAADFLLKTYGQFGIGTSHVLRLAGHRTSRCIILLVAGEDRRYLFVRGANELFGVRHLSREWLSSLRVFYLGGLFVLPGIHFGELKQILEFCHACKVKTVVDVIVPQDLHRIPDVKPLLPHIDVFVPNEEEARALTGVTDPYDQLRAFQSFGANTVIVTRGDEGSMALESGKIWRCGTYQMDTVDPSGSGDAFASGVVRGLIERWDLPQTLRYASAVGASVTRAPGANESVFSAAEAEVFVAAHPLAVTELS
jgi:sugar/nucleoside kinase (ribokinase family)